MRLFSARRAAVFGLVVFGSVWAPFATAAKPIDQEPQLPPHVRLDQTGFVATMKGETMRVLVCGSSVIHVLTAPGEQEPQASSPAQPWMLAHANVCPGSKFDVRQDAGGVSLTTNKLKVTLENKGGNLVFSSKEGVQLLRESPAVPRTYSPVVLDGTKIQTVEDRFLPEISEGFYGLGQHQSGVFDYRGMTVELGQDNTDITVPLLISTNGYGLLWNTASLSYFDNRYPKVLKLSATDANAIDYYFIYGPEMDDVIHQYREMTGRVPLLPKWAYGFFQSKDSYKSQAEVLDIATRYRSEHLPLDCMVQDGGWWKVQGDLAFRSTYPDVPAEINELHKKHVHTMLSVWGLYEEGSDNLKTLQAKGWLVPGTLVYDATNPAARDFFWKSLPGPLLAQGWDSFWLDASEPDSGPHEGDVMLLNRQIAIGSGDMYTNVFPLLHTEGISDHWKETTTEKRVLLLTRSAFLGEQRNGVIVWSGDVFPTAWAFRHQIAAGLNFALSGFPYWTTDVAGYFPLYQDAPMTSPAYQDLYARWFEFGAFSPIFRTHGHRPHNEIWTYDKVEPVLASYDHLRYRLMPYIYSLAWKVTDSDYTMLRPLVMDWRTDRNTWDIADEYMFGPAFLVSPVWQEGAHTREVYLPQATAWYDFWTGKKVRGRQTLEVDAPIQTLPLFMRAGSIVPMGPEIQYAEQKTDDPVEIRIYRGADGAFDLYEDEGDSYRYEQGAHAVIPMRWNEATRTFSLDDRVGTFPGMREERTFRIVLVGANHGVGAAISSTADAVVKYSGKAEKVTFLHEPERP